MVAIHLGWGAVGTFRNVASSLGWLLSPRLMINCGMLAGSSAVRIVMCLGLNWTIWYLSFLSRKSTEKTLG